MSPNPDADAAAAFTARRVEQGLTQERIRELTGVSVPTIIKFEKARTWPRERTLTKLEDVVGLPPGTLRAIRAGKPGPGQATEPDPAAALVLDALRSVETIAGQAIRLAHDPIAAAGRLAAVRRLIETLTTPPPNSVGE